MNNELKAVLITIGVWLGLIAMFLIIATAPELMLKLGSLALLLLWSCIIYQVAYYFLEQEGK